MVDSHPHPEISLQSTFFLGVLQASLGIQRTCIPSSMPAATCIVYEAHLIFIALLGKQYLIHSLMRTLGLRLGRDYRNYPQTVNNLEHQIN